jgi:hypothetical protein
MYFRIHTVWCVIGRASFKFCMGDKFMEQMEGGKKDDMFSVHCNVHIPIQIVILNNFENCRPPSKMNPAPMRCPEKGKKY